MRFPLFLRISSLFLIAGSIWLAAQNPPFQLESDARNVAVDFSVLDSSGRLLTRQLQKEDFAVYEDGVPQEIQAFHTPDTPYDMLILIDCSNSTKGDWRFMGDAVERFVERIRDQDRFSVAQFGSRIENLIDWQTKKGNPPIVSVQGSSRSCSDTKLYEVLETSITRFKGNRERQGIIVLTDGINNPFPTQSAVVGGERKIRYSNAEDDPAFQKMLKAVAKSKVVFYFVAVNTDMNPDPISPYSGSWGSSVGRAFDPSRIYDMQQARARMQIVAEMTGGHVAYPKKPAEVVPLYEDIAREFGTYYRIWYVPPNSASTKERKIEVKVQLPGATVRQTRDTYSPVQ